jgi:hypothetical protein
MDLKSATDIFNVLYSDVNGYALSNAARQKLNHYDKSHTYGEVSAESIYRILNEVKPKEGEIFYDLGSGTGKAVIMAALTYPFAKCKGVELLDDLHDGAVSVLKRYDTEIKAHMQDQLDQTEIEFIHANFFECDLRDANVIFVHSTCLDEYTMNKLEEKLAYELLPQTRVVTVTKTFQSDVFDLKKYQEYNMAWGKAIAFFYEKV